MAQQIDVAGTHGGRFVASDQIRYVNINLNATRHMGEGGNQAPFAGNRRQQHHGLCSRSRKERRASHVA